MPDNKPNIVFFFTDDQRFSAIDALGIEDVRTPNIDKLAARGTLFTHAHIPCGTSGAVCMPSRAMLHTGRTLFHIEGAGESIPNEHRMLGETLQNNGYRTFGSGKWHNGRASYQRSFTDGDEIMFGGMADHWNVPVYHFDPTGRYDSRLALCREPTKSNRVSMLPADHVHAGVHSSEILADATVKFIAEYDDDKPFFAYLSFLAPHDPRTMPERFLNMYDPDRITLPRNFTGGHSFDNGSLHIRDEELASFPREPMETRRHIAEYYGMITHLDYELSRVVDALESKGILDETIIVFAGDNGLAVGQHGLFGKQNCYEHSVRVPLIFAGPGVPQGSRSDAYVYLFDVFPTLCDLTGIDTPDTVEGESLVKAMGDPGKAIRETMYFAYCDSQRAVKTRQHKLVEYVVDGQNNMTQLFDLDKDPWEISNLAAEPGHEQQVDDLRREMARLCDEWGDKETSWGKAFWSGMQWG
jgi:arylsulfatase A-like enzyme